jgi:hypothetical protein
MRTRGLGGGSRNYGDQMIPKHLKQKGLGEHPKMTKFINQPPPDVPCGILAVLLGWNTEYYLENFEVWLSDASMYGELIGLKSKFMINEDFEKLLALDGFRDYRIIVFRVDGQVEFGAQGDEWIWPEDKLRIEPDLKSLYVLRDRTDTGNKHYWWLSAIKSVRYNLHRDTKFCYFCFRQAKQGESFDDHHCNGFQTIQCRICKIYFTSMESFNHHISKATTIYNCDCCKRTTFNGYDCFIRHERENCNPPLGSNKATCLECGRKYIVEMEHDCNNFGNCKSCEHEFESFADKDSHRCYLASSESFWDPVSDKGKFECHFGYDYETCREIVEEETNSYKHEVMAWCVRLMVPCDVTRQFILDSKFREAIQKGIEDSPPDVKRDIKCEFIEPDVSIRIWGKELESFIFLSTNILCQKKWKPILWAHNGSKFDAKFILDYFLNELNMDLAGATYDEEFKELVIGSEGKKVWKRLPYHKGRKNVCKVSMIGSKILELKVKGVSFRCTYAHHAAPLRELPSRFGLNIQGIKKGEFPYPLLKRCNWGKVFPTFPALELFDVDCMSAKRRKQVLSWHAEQPDEPWDFDKELWGYLFADVDVLCKVMEAYHQKTEEMHIPLWRKNSERIDKYVSPLQCATLPGWALTMYKTWFMPPDQLAILKPSEAKLVRESLHGGRTDKRANYMDLQTPHDRIEYVDFKSLYPSVQDCKVHDTHFPVGVPSWGRFNGPSSNEKLIADMGDKTGFVRISCKPLKYVTHPTLHRTGKYSKEEQGVKLLFELDQKVSEVYAWPEIQEAIRCGEIEVTEVHDCLLFDKGTYVFAEYVDFFFKLKEDAEVAGNEGLRSLAKLLLNSLWGKLGQRSYSEREWVEDTGRRDYLLSKFDSGEFQMQSCILKDEYRAFFEYRLPDDFNNLSSTACHIAAFVSMWGRVVLHKKLLHPHGMRAMYCDTDSAIVYLRHGIDPMYYLGNKLGDLTNEVKKMVDDSWKDPFINQVVMLAPKTYALEVKDKEDPTKIYHKTVCKGFEPSFDNAQKINFQSMKELVFTNYNLNSFMNKKRPGEHVDVARRLVIKGGTRLSFKSSMARNEITPVEVQVQKNLNGNYTKGRVHPVDPRFIAPFSKMKINPPPRETFLTKRHMHFE